MNLQQKPDLFLMQSEKKGSKLLSQRFLIMKTTTAKIDLVKKNRNIRDELSLEIMDMTYDQEKEYIKTELAKLKLENQNRQFSKHL